MLDTLSKVGDRGLLLSGGPSHPAHRFTERLVYTRHLHVVLLNLYMMK